MVTSLANYRDEYAFLILLPKASQFPGRDPASPVVCRSWSLYPTAFGEVFFPFFFFFLGTHLWHMEVPTLGVESELPAYTTAHGNAGSLTYRARPGIEPASSWFLVRFISTEPQWELQHLWCVHGQSPRDPVIGFWVDTS